MPTANQTVEDTTRSPLADAMPEEQTPPEPDATMAVEMRELRAMESWEAGTPPPVAPEEIVYDFPVTMNRQVEFYLDFFTGRSRKNFATWLTRSSRYLPMIKKQLKEAGLPLDLAYLPMIESGFNLTAYSSARATGPWQFMSATGRRYGLTINEYVDERRDPEKSTRAAVNYLKDLYDQFQSWHLAVAGYNAGEGKIKRAIQKYKTHDFWTLARNQYLKLETKRYVPKLIAAIVIAKNPEAYGFENVEYQEPLAYDTIEVGRWTSLRAVAVACGRPFEEIWDLNRQLRKAITPPTSAKYKIKVPAGEGSLVAQNLPRVRATVLTEYKTHIVRQGETLTQICRKYNLNKTTMLKANNLRSAQLTPSQRLRIPYQTTDYTLVAKTDHGKPAGPAAETMANLILHKVRPGETLSEIARRYQVPMHLIAAWNDLKDLATIHAGQQLALYLTDSDNDQLAATDNQNETQAALDGVEENNQPAKPKSGVKLTYYQVRGGDSLWKIAKKFNITPEEIRRWNKLDGNIIRPGHRLLIKLAADADV